jgi:hypothetical protein
MRMLLIALFALSGLSCLNPFAPRLNTGLGVQICGDLTQAENVFCSFRNAYLFKDTTLYGSLLSPDFVFIYTDYDQLVEKNWGRDDEMRLTYTMFQSVQSLALTWNTEIALNETDTLLSVERGYTLTVSFSTADVAQVNGVANFVFLRPRAGESWQILRWQDKSNF